MIHQRMLSAFLAFCMVVTLFGGFGPLHVHAETGENTENDILPVTEEQMSNNTQLFNNTIKALLADKEKLIKMEQQSAEMGIKDGCERIYNEIKLLVKKNQV